MQDLTKGNSTKLIFAFAIPILIGNLLQLTYNLVDTRIVGQILGTQSLAAVGATNSINTLIVGFLQGLTNGFAVIVAQKFGAKDAKELRRSLASSLVLGLVTSLVLTILSTIFLMPILRVLHTPEEVIAQSYEYIVIIFIGMTITMLYNLCAGVLRAIGDTITPLIFLAISVVLNIVGDYFFIVNCGLGVRGAAIATILSQLFATILCVVYMLKKYDIFHLKRSDFRMEVRLIKNLYGAGVSMGFMASFVSLGTLALQSAINTFGTNIIVAHTAARKITELYMLAFTVFGTTMATYCGQNLGAGEFGRIKEGIRNAILICWIWCIGVVISSYTIAPFLIQMVTGTNEPEIIHTASLYLRVDTLFYFVTAMIIVIRNAMQGIGDHITPIGSSMIELIGKVVIVILLVPKLGYMGVIVSEPIVWFLMVIPLIIQICRQVFLEIK